MNKRLKVLYFGTWGYGKAGLQALVENERVEVVKIFTKWDTEVNDPYLNQVNEFAKSTGIPIVNTLKEQLTKSDFEKIVLDSGEVDFILSCCFDRVFSDQVLHYPDKAALNLHPSILPKYRGIKPLENALVNNESEIGVTLHVLSDEMDAGDIVLQTKDPIQIHQTFKQLYDLQCVQVKKIISVFFEAPDQYLQSKQKQNESEKSMAPRLPFDINDDDTVSDIICKAKEFKLI